MERRLFGTDGVRGTANIEPVTAETAKLYALGLPAMLVGLWSGFKLYGKLDDAAFRKLILLFLLISGLALIVPASVFR